LNLKPVAALAPLCLCLLAGNARAELEPFSFGASETIQHESNILHTLDVDRRADWLSTTEFRAALDQAISRERLKASASVDLARYGQADRHRDSVGYAAAGEFDWETVGDLSGAIGADSRRHQYLYGLDEGPASTSRNLQTDNHAFARVRLGGLARWSIFSGFDASQRKYSDPTFDFNETQQWAVSAGTDYSTSPDLSFGLQGRYVRGKYPKLTADLDSFSIKTVGAHTRWVASGNTSLDANVGYTQQRTDGEPDLRYVNGGLNLHWAPPSHFEVTLGASRDSDTNAGIPPTVVNTSNGVSGRSLNTAAHLDVAYELTAKVKLDVDAQYIHRKYVDALVPKPFIFGDEYPFEHVTGTTNTTRFTLGATYMPTRTITTGCSVSREVHASEQSVRDVAGPYTDNTVQCTAAISFD
jgi:putative beta-barrel porin BBP2